MVVDDHVFAAFDEVAGGRIPRGWEERERFEFVAPVAHHVLGRLAWVGRLAVLLAAGFEFVGVVFFDEARMVGCRRLGFRAKKQVCTVLVGEIVDSHCVLWERLLADRNGNMEASIAPGMCAHLKSCGVHLEARQVVERGGHDLKGFLSVSNSCFDGTVHDKLCTLVIIPLQVTMSASHFEPVLRSRSTKVFSKLSRWSSAVSSTC